MTTSPVTLFKEAPEANIRRQYSIEVVQDLFGAAVVVCRWGRIGAHGQRREHVCASHDEAQVFAAKLVRKREVRGYSRHRAEASVTTTARGSNNVRAATATARLRPARATRRRMQRNAQQLTLWALDEPAATAASTSTQTATPTTVQMPSSAASLEAQSEARRQADIERILEASRKLAMRAGAPLEIVRGDSLIPKPTDERMTCHEREMLIEKCIGVPRAGWPHLRLRA